MGINAKPPLCKGRWHFRKKMTEGLSLFFINSRLESTLQSVCRLTAPLAQGSLFKLLPSPTVISICFTQKPLPPRYGSTFSLPFEGNGVKHRKRCGTDEVTDAKHPQKLFLLTQTPLPRLRYEAFLRLHGHDHRRQRNGRDIRRCAG